MMRVKLTGFDASTLKKAAFAEVEREIARVATAAARPYGGVRVRFDRGSDGLLRKVLFEGSESAIHAATQAIERTK
jgi:hypothetical protein